MSNGGVLSEDCRIHHLAGWLTDFEHCFPFGLSLELVRL